MLVSEVAITALVRPLQCLLISFIWLWFVAISVADSGDTAGSIEYKTLTLKCAGCASHEDGSCEMPVRGEPRILPCGEAFALIFNALASAGYDGRNPTPEELRRFLVQKDTTPEDAKPVFELLCQSGEGSSPGEKILTANAPIFIGKYPQLIQEFVLAGKCSPDTWFRYWQLPQTEGVPVGAQLRAVIASKNPKLGIADLFAELSVSDIEHDLAELKVMESTLAEQRSPWVGDIREAERRLSICSTIGTTGQVPSGCSVQELKGLPDHLGRYLERVQVQQVLGYLNKLGRDNSGLNQSLSIPLETLRLIAQTNYASYRTPEMHRQVLAASDGVLRSGTGELRSAILTPTILPMLLTFAKNDNETASRFALILIASAEAAVKLEDFAGAAGYLELSLEAYPSPIVSRDQLIAEVGESAPAQTKKLIQARFRTLEKNSSVFSRSGSGILFYGLIAIFAVAVVMFSVSIRAKFSQARAVTAQQILTEEERRELRQLCDYFEIPPYSKEEDLTRIYRTRAKELHPDTGGDVHAFGILNDNYRRAYDLMTKR